MIPQQRLDLEMEISDATAEALDLIFPMLCSLKIYLSTKNDTLASQAVENMLMIITYMGDPIESIPEGHREIVRFIRQTMTYK
jgi:hypothetical protein